MYSLQPGRQAIVRHRQTCELEGPFHVALSFHRMLFLVLQLFHGAAIGSLYGLLGLALGLLTRRNVVPNLSLGAIATLAGLTAYWFSDRYNMPLVLSLLFGMIVAAMLTALVEVSTVATLGRPGVLRQTPFAPVIAAMAAWVALDAVASLAAGPNGILFAPDGYPATVFGADDSVLRLMDLLLLILSVAAATIVRRILVGTLFGTALRAIRFDAHAAAIGGVNPRRVLLLAALGAGALAGLVGICAAVAASQAGTPVTVELGQSLLWKAVAALVLAGCASHGAALRPGTIMLTGVALGMVEAVCGVFLPQWMPITPWQGAAGTMLLLAVLACPNGLVARRRKAGTA